MADRYRETLARLIALEARKGMDFRLERLAPVLDVLGHPERNLGTVVHVAGTNGKGSTAAMIDSALRRGGWRTALYTSPHLVSFRERIRVDGVPIEPSAVVRLVEKVEQAAAAAGEALTFFEVTTLAAFEHFREQRVDAAVVEAGLGGRLDATNVVHGDVAVISSVGIDHAQFLGDTVEAIAGEKAGIVKPGSVLVTGLLPEAALAVVQRRAREVGAKHLAWERDFGGYAPLRECGGAQPPAASSGEGAEASAGTGSPLAGAHQVRNAGVAATVLEVLSDRLPVSGPDRLRGILEARWPGRLEVLRRRGGGTLVLDAAHNPEAAEVLRASLDDVAPQRPRVLVFASMADKDWRSVLGTLGPAFDRVVGVPLGMARAERPEAFATELPGLLTASGPIEGLGLADQLAGTHGSVVVAGSIFLLGALYRAAGGTLLEEALEAD